MEKGTQMNLKRPLLIASMALAAFAFAAPMAQAQLYELGPNEEHELLNVEDEVTATSTNLVTHSAVGTLECNLVTIHMKVTDNTPPEGSAEELATTVEGCNHTITKPMSGELTLTAGEEGTGGTGLGEGATFTVEVFCTFSGNIPFSYETNSNVLTVTGENQLSSGLCGSATMTGEFTLETKDKTPVYIT